MKIAIGADHAGYQLKESLKRLLDELGLLYEDFGTTNGQSVDYPDFAQAVATGVATGNFDRGILVCGTGVGMAIAANKVHGVRAALCNDLFTARLSREHNDANVLSMGGRIVATGLADDILELWLNTAFAGGRHQRRIDQITAGEAAGGRI